MNTHINRAVFGSFPVLETERLVLRQFTTDDTSAFFQIRSNPKVMQYMDSFPHESQHESHDMIIQMLDSFAGQEGINWAVELRYNRKMIGYIGFWRLFYENVRAEIGYSLHPDYWGQGYMIEALTEVLRFGFQNLNVHSVEASVNPGNKASIGLLKKIGFQREAFFRENYYFNGDFSDSILYCMLETDFSSE